MSFSIVIEARYSNMPPRVAAWWHNSREIGDGTGIEDGQLVRREPLHLQEVRRSGMKLRRHPRRAEPTNKSPPGRSRDTMHVASESHDSGLRPI
jgi:hypothetical protein